MLKTDSQVLLQMFHIPSYKIHQDRKIRFVPILCIWLRCGLSLAENSADENQVPGGKPAHRGGPAPSAGQSAARPGRPHSRRPSESRRTPRRLGGSRRRRAPPPSFRAASWFPGEAGGPRRAAAAVSVPVLVRPAGGRAALQGWPAGAGGGGAAGSWGRGLRACGGLRAPRFPRGRAPRRLTSRASGRRVAGCCAVAAAFPGSKSGLGKRRERARERKRKPTRRTLNFVGLSFL